MTTKTHRVVQDENGFHIELGFLVKAAATIAMGLVLGAIASVPFLRSEVSQAQEAVTELAETVDEIAEKADENSTNIRDLQEGQRIMKLEQNWTNDQLEAIVKKMQIPDVRRRSPQPAQPEPEPKSSE